MDPRNNDPRGEPAPDHDQPPVVGHPDEPTLVDWGENEIFMGGYGYPRSNRTH